jgi:AcrR family transcriptional regulator
MKVDRRIQKTKKLLTEALIDLILLKGYQNVTIQDILDKANVGRSTFYNHYENKELLFIDGPRNLGLSLFSEEAKNPNLPTKKITFYPLFQHVSKNLSLAKALFGEKSGNIMLESFTEQIADTIKEHYKIQFNKTKKEKLKLSYHSRAAAAAVVSMLVTWIDNNLEITAEEIATQADAVIVAIVKKI